MHSNMNSNNSSQIGTFDLLTVYYIEQITRLESNNLKWIPVNFRDDHLHLVEALSAASP